MPDANALYPQAQAAPQSLATGSPQNMIGTIQGLQNMQVMQSQIPALSAQPAAQLQGQNIANSTAQFNQENAMRLAVQGAFGTALAGNPNPTAEDIHNLTANVSTLLPQIAVSRPDIINGVASSLLNSKGGIKNAASTMLNMSMSPSENSDLVDGPPDPVTGVPTKITRAVSNMMAGIRPAGLPPGVASRYAANQAEFATDQSKSAQILAGVRPLQQALPLIENLSNSNFGPLSPQFAHTKGALTTMGIINPNTSDLQVRQEVGKYLLNYAQGAQNAGRSDSALSTAIGSNPNLDLTQPANLALVKNQIARDRMDAALPLAGAADAGGVANYKDFKSKYYQNNDMRAFKFDAMTPEERGALQKSLGPVDSPAYKRFLNSYIIAKRAGMVTPGVPAGQQ